MNIENKRLRNDKLKLNSYATLKVDTLQNVDNLDDRFKSEIACSKFYTHQK